MTLFRLILSGPREAEQTALVLNAHDITPSGGDVFDLGRHLGASSIGSAPGWRCYQDYGMFYIAGPSDLDVTPFLQTLAQWLETQAFVTKIIVKSSTAERFSQIQSVFPDAVVG